jgi:Spy/CpxP family protein refolding chaperone
MAARSKRREAGKEALAVLTPEQREKLRETYRQRHAGWRAKGDSMHQERHGARHHAPADSSKTTK